MVTVKHVAIVSGPPIRYEVRFTIGPECEQRTVVLEIDDQKSLENNEALAITTLLMDLAEQEPPEVARTMQIVSTKRLDAN